MFYQANIPQFAGKEYLRFCFIAYYIFLFADIFKGNYNGINYLVHELNLLSRSGKSSTIHFSGLILKTKYNPQNQGSIEIETKESQEEYISNLKQLFMSNEIKCKFYDGNIMLAISTRENLFETGDLLKPPTHPKVAERFISQLAGILIFMDYIATEMNKH